MRTSRRLFMMCMRSRTAFTYTLGSKARQEFFPQSSYVASRYRPMGPESRCRAFHTKENYHKTPI